MEGDREPACLSPFTALWTWTPNGYHMADEGERRGEPCVNPAEFMGDKEEVEKRKRFGRVWGSALLGRLHSCILFNWVQTQSASLIYSDGVRAFLFIPPLPDPSLPRSVLSSRPLIAEGGLAIAAAAAVLYAPLCLCI